LRGRDSSYTRWTFTYVLCSHAWRRREHDG